MSIPDEVIDAIQSKFVEFLWQGKHWISKEMLYLPVNMGGQGLVHIISRIHDFGIQFVYRFLNISNDEECHPCFFIFLNISHPKCQTSIMMFKCFFSMVTSNIVTFLLFTNN